MSSRKDLDHFYKRAKGDGYKARSVFKLMELNQKYRFIKKNMIILDLGASPGSWMQYLSEEVGPSGKIVGVDLNPLKVEISEPNLFLQMSVLDLTAAEVKKRSQVSQFHVVVSDMAPKTTGHEFSDHMKSFELCGKALELARELLKPNGSFVCKMFQGEHTKSFLKELESSFSFCKSQKPQASRSESREIFLIATGYGS